MTFKEELKTATTLDEFLIICGKHYDLKNARLGTIAKAQLINNIDKIIALAGAKPKK